MSTPEPIHGFSKEKYKRSLDLAKLRAKIILSPGHRHKMVVPDREEWIGINALELDDQLPERKSNT